MFPKRKSPRLKKFDYSTSGGYFITICTQNKENVLSHIVGRGLAPAETAIIEYTPYGKIAERNLLSLQDRYPNLTVDKYVIMPNHIHMVLILHNDTVNTAGASPRPTVSDIICAYKSLTSIECRKNGFVGKLFQTSFNDHVIRNDDDYREIIRYIDENPLKRSIIDI